MKTGMMLGFEDSIKTMTTIAGKQSEPGHTLYTVDAGRSATITAAAVINATERARVGTYIVNAFAREPWMTGLEARDLNEISGGRFVLGVGTGNLHFNDLYMGIDSSKAKAKMQDFMEIVRLVVSGKAAERVRYQGDVHRIRWRATWNPTTPTPPIYMSASGPNMVRLAGAVSDGVGIGIMSSVEFVRDIVRPNARLGAEQAGRDPDALLFPHRSDGQYQQRRRSSAGGQQASHLQALSPDTSPLLRLSVAATGLCRIRRPSNEAGSGRQIDRGHGFSARRGGRHHDDHRHSGTVCRTHSRL